ncbi:synuclein-like isoform X4 [Salvelinus fontinalis]|uniref:synuclein-like isoform X4 n=1 Tax=Salvelinus fontinalis TaxID=8038 RepID=UPI002485C7DB|nr:synuclein-like isoform X4 [Salvelinus fontinalis]
MTLACCACFLMGNKTKDGMVAGVNTVAQRTTDQANIVGDATVAGANELSQQTVEGLENVAVNSGLVNQEQGQEEAVTEVAGSGLEGGDFSQGAEQAGQ